MDNDIIEKVLHHLRSNAEATAASPRRTLRLRGSCSEKYRETVESLAERMLDKLRVNEQADQIADLTPDQMGSDEPAAIPQAGEHLSSIVEPAPVENRSQRRPVISLKGDIAASDRAALYAHRQGFQVQVVKRRSPSVPDRKPFRSSDISASSVERRTYEDEVNALYWPSLSEQPRHNTNTPRFHTSPSSEHIPLPVDQPDELKPLKHPTQIARRKQAEPPPVPEHRNGRIHFEHDDTVRKLAEPLRKAIKHVGIKQYGIITCFNVICEMLGYNDYNDFMDRFEDFPPSPTDLQASPDERLRRYQQYRAALEKRGFSSEQAKDAVKLSRSGEWFGFDDIQALITERLETPGTANGDVKHYVTTSSTRTGRPPIEKDIGYDRVVAAEIMGFPNRNVALSVGEKIRNALRKHGIECSLSLGREYAAKMFGYENLNNLMHTCGTRPRSLPDDMVSETEQATRLGQYANVLMGTGLTRAEAIEVLRACRISGWLAFWGRD